MEANSAHTIAFSGLQDGHHEFHFVLADAFFEAAGVEDISGGEVSVKVNMEKSAHLLVTNIRTQGTVQVACDRCAAPMEQRVEGDQRQIFRLDSEEDFEDDDELVGLPPGETEVNLTHYFYECITLNLPARYVHPAGQCDPDVEQALERVRVAQPTEEATDPRWEALKNLKQN